MEELDQVLALEANLNEIAEQEEDFYMTSEWMMCPCWSIPIDTLVFQ